MSALQKLKNSLPGIEWYRRRRWMRQAVARSNSWTRADEEKAAFYKQFVNPGDIVFDVGANEGNRTKLFVRLAGKVVAVEPQPQCVELLQKVFASDKKVVIAATALGAKPGSAPDVCQRCQHYFFIIPRMDRGG